MHVSVSEGTKRYIEDEGAKLEKFYSPVIDANVKISEEGRQHKVDLVVHIHAHTLKSSGEEEKIHSAIDQAINRMISQLKKLHDKQKRFRGENREEPTSEG